VEHPTTVDVRVARPHRTQRKRAPGWRATPGTVYVGRPSKWGNPYRVGPLAAAQAVERYRADLLAGRLAVSLADVRAELRGKDLACWCAPGQPCHADLLLELANAPDASRPGGARPMELTERSRERTRRGGTARG
jgi:hypothetical protein